LFRHAVAVLAAGIALAGCSHSATTTHPSTPTPVPTSALDGLFPSVGDVSAVMGTTMTPHESFSRTRDHSELLPNLNCLGIWQVGEKTIYDPSGYNGIRGQVLREPDTDNWNSRVVQAVVSYPSADAAKKFFGESADRWSHCSNHQVNMTQSGHSKITLTFGSLTKTDTALTMSVSSGGGGASCQRVLAVDNNLIVDVSACGHSITNQANSLVSKLEASIPA
jgi:PknH-like extracellular domain